MHTVLDVPIIRHNSLTLIELTKFQCEDELVCSRRFTHVTALTPEIERVAIPANSAPDRVIMVMRERTGMMKMAVAMDLHVLVVGPSP